MIADATYGVPLYGYTTTASKGDSSELPKMLDGATQTLTWLSPKYVMADRGYDSTPNHKAVQERGAFLISPTRRLPHNALFEGVYTDEGVPTCFGMVAMEYVRSDPQMGHLYRCRREKCHLNTRKGRRYCNRRFGRTAPTT